MPDSAPVPGPRIPSALVRAGAAGRLVILVGPSASREAGVPPTATLLRTLLDHALGEAPDRGAFAEARSWFDKPGDDRGHWGRLPEHERVLGPVRCHAVYNVGAARVPLPVEDKPPRVPAPWHS